MEFYKAKILQTQNIEDYWTSANIIEIEQQALLYLTEKICRDKNCRYPQLTLRVFLHMLARVDEEGKIYVSARKIAKEIDVNYDTVTKCLKYLRQLNVVHIKR